MDTRQTEKQELPASAPTNGRTDGPAAASKTDAPPAAPEKKDGNPNVRRVAMLVGAIVVILLLVWGVRYFLYARTHQTTDDAKVDADAVSVTSKLSERVANILVDSDQQVRKGQLLVQLDDQDERSRLLQAEGAVAAQRAQAAAAQANVSLTQQTVSAQNQESQGGITQAQSGISNAQANVAQAQAGVVQAQSAVPAALQALNRANADLRRTQSLVSTGDLPRQQLDAARANAAAAQSQYQEALANVNAAQARVVAAQSGIGAAQGQLSTAAGKLQESADPSRVAASQAQANAQYASVGSLQAQSQLAKDQLTYTRITSPIDGYVGAKNVEVGATVAPGITLMTIIPSTHVYITANFKETQVGDMHPGQPVDIKVDAYKGVNFHGHVIAINPASQNTYSLVPSQNASGNFIKVTQRIPVKIGIDNPPADKPLRPGMSVETSVQVK